LQQSVSLGVFTGAYDEVTKKFSLAPGDYCIAVLNGPPGYRRASSARVALDGEPLWTESSFNQNFAGATKIVTVKDVGNTLEVLVKSGQKKQGEKAHAVEVLVGHVAPSSGMEPKPPLIKVGSAGANVSDNGVSITFDAGAVSEDVILSVQCKDVVGGVTPYCKIDPHFSFPFGTVAVTMPITVSNLPSYAGLDAVVMYKGAEQLGVQIPL
jgi:hypothetical protein